MNICPICKQPNEGGGYSMPGGLAHSHCFNREHPPTPAQTLHQMARGRGDPALAAQVIAEWVPPDLAEKIVDDFNERLMKQWQRRCEP